LSAHNNYKVWLGMDMCGGVMRGLDWKGKVIKVRRAGDGR